MIALEINVNDAFFEGITSISNFNIYDAFWKRYVKFALPKINKAIELLQKDKPNLQLLTPEEAKKQLLQLTPLVVYLLKYKEDMKEINKKEKQEFFEKGLELINEIETTAEILEEISEPNYFYNAFCKSALNDDWNDPINDHWDNENY